jgi:hypothetical protein
MSLDKDCCLKTHTDAYRQGGVDELNRIIALLEDKLEYVDYEGLADGKRILRVESLIAVIKGENK